MDLDDLLTTLRGLLVEPPSLVRRDVPLNAALASWPEPELPEVVVSYLLDHAAADRVFAGYLASLG